MMEASVGGSIPATSTSDIEDRLEVKSINAVPGSFEICFAGDGPAKILADLFASTFIESTARNYLETAMALPVSDEPPVEFTKSQLALDSYKLTLDMVAHVPTEDHPDPTMRFEDSTIPTRRLPLTMTIQYRDGKTPGMLASERLELLERVVSALPLNSSARTEVEEYLKNF